MEAVIRAGDMRARVRDFDWSATPLGPAETWSPSLTWSVELILASGFPMAVRWGPELVVIYNDAYPASSATSIRTRSEGRCARSGRKSTASSGRSTKRSCAASATPFLPKITSGRSAGRHSPRTPVSRSAIARSPIRPRRRDRRRPGHRVRDHRARAQREDAAPAHRTARSEVEQRTRERDRIWQVSEDLLGVSTFAGYFISVNPAWTTLLGWSEDEIKSMHVSELRHPDDAAAANAGRARLAKACRPCAWRTVFVTRTGAGAGSPGQ